MPKDSNPKPRTGRHAVDDENQNLAACVLDRNADAEDIRRALRRCRAMSEQYGPKLNAISGQNRDWTPAAGSGPRIVFANPPNEAVFLVAVDRVGQLKIVTVLTASMIDERLRKKTEGIAGNGT